MNYWSLLLSKVSSLALVDFDGLEEGLEVTCSKALVVPSLDDFNEEGWSVLERLGEDLQQISLLIVVHQDVQLLNDIKVLCDLGSAFLELDPKILVVLLGDGQEVAASGLHLSNCM